VNMRSFFSKWMLSGVYRDALWPGAKIRYSKRHNKIVVSNASGKHYTQRTNRYSVIAYYMDCFDKRSYYVDSWYRYWYYQLKEYLLRNDWDE